MKKIFPPYGDQDTARFASVSQDDREYMWFCLELCDTILSRRPDHLEALETAANHYTALGYYADGLDLDYRLADLKADDPGILYNLSCSLALVGKRDEALSRLETAVAKGYRDHKHMANDRDLQSLKTEPKFTQIVDQLKKELK